MITSFKRSRQSSPAAEGGLLSLCHAQKGTLRGCSAVYTSGKYVFASPVQSLRPAAMVPSLKRTSRGRFSRDFLSGNVLEIFWKCLEMFWKCFGKVVLVFQ